jgi:hypothetical protein
MLQRVERRALGGEHRPRIALQAHQQVAPGRRASPSSTSSSISTSGSSARKKAAAMSQPGNHDRLAAVHLAVKRASAGMVAAR